MKTKSIYKVDIRTRKIHWKIYIGIFCLTVIASCEDLLEVDPPRSQIGSEQVFNDNTSAEAAARGMYGDMLTVGHAFYGDQNSLLALTGLSSDELFHPPGTNIASMQFEENTLIADNQLVSSLWSDIYQTIYSANALIEGVKASTTLSKSIRDQLKGEALFVRAFCHFYLVNLFGDVPLVMTTDYQENAVISKTDTGEIYKQIEKDLLLAIELLSPDLTDGERVRPNQGTAMALLSRVYLYRENWVKAENMATIVINDGNYALVELNDITLSGNKEAIWQLHSSSTAINAATGEGISFNFPSSLNALRGELVDAFESGDMRRIEWVRLVDSSFYTPFKYKVSGSGTDRSEYSTIFRLAEQYLIRAEARAQQQKLGTAIADLDVIRDRAGLPLISEVNPEIGQTELLEVIMHERRVELFTEWGHRWLDLKRTEQAAIVLNSLKPEFGSEDELYPIPQQELNNNPNLKQNPGY